MYRYPVVGSVFGMDDDRHQPSAKGWRGACDYLDYRYRRQFMAANAAACG